MSDAERNFQLYCDATNSLYVLAKEGEKWRETFASFDDAYVEAETRATEATSMTVYNELGKVILTTRVSPLMNLRQFCQVATTRRER